MASLSVAWAFEPKERFDDLPDRFFQEHAKASKIASFPHQSFLAAHRPDRQTHPQSYYIMTGDHMVSKLSGNTLYGVTITRDRPPKLYALWFRKDGVVCGQLSDGRREQGLWWVSNNGFIFSKWPSWHAGVKIQLRYYEAPEKNHLIEVTRDGRYGLILIKKGNPEHLCE